MKIVTVLGARPQFIKASTVSHALRTQGRITEVIVHTGQHYDANMSDVFFDELDIPRPHYNLGIGGGGHGKMTGRQLEGIEKVLLEERPDWLLVYGDTNSTLAGALAAAKLHLPVAHVEAGLRSFNRRMPEEINRVLTDHISDMLFAPTEAAIRNLAAEGISGTKVHRCGDVMYDAVLLHRKSARKPEWFDQIGISGFVLCTIHRAENTDDFSRLRAIFGGLKDAGRPVIMPLHPRTAEKVSNFGITPGDNIKIVRPVGYLEMAWLQTNCSLVVTDSGGIQKEAYFHEKPCVTVRDQTEWHELVDIGVNELVGADAAKLSGAVRQHFGRSLGTSAGALYGDGSAARYIAEELSRR